MTVNLITSSENEFDEKLRLFSQDEERVPVEVRGDLKKYAILSKVITGANRIVDVYE